MEFSRPEYWSESPSTGDRPSPGMEPRSPALQEDSSPAEPARKPRDMRMGEFKSDQGPKMRLHSRRPRGGPDRLSQTPAPGISLFDTVHFKRPDLHTMSQRTPGERPEECRLPRRTDVETRCELLSVSDQIRRRQGLRSLTARSFDTFPLKDWNRGKAHSNGHHKTRPLGERPYSKATRAVSRTHTMREGPGQWGNSPLTAGVSWAPTNSFVGVSTHPGVGHEANTIPH